MIPFQTLHLNMRLTLVHNFEKFQQSLVPEIDRFSTSTLAHIVSIGTAVHSYNEELVRKCTQIMKERISDTRIKDLERFVS